MNEHDKPTTLTPRQKQLWLMSAPAIHYDDEPAPDYQDSGYHDPGWEIHEERVPVAFRTETEYDRPAQYNWLEGIH